MRSLILPFIAPTIISTPATAGPKQFEFEGLVVGSKTAPAMVMAALGFGCDAGAKGMKVCNGPINIGSTDRAGKRCHIAQGHPSAYRADDPFVLFR